MLWCSWSVKPRRREGQRCGWQAFGASEFGVAKFQFALSLDLPQVHKERSVGDLSFVCLLIQWLKHCDASYNVVIQVTNIVLVIRRFTRWAKPLK